MPEYLIRRTTGLHSWWPNVPRDRLLDVLQPRGYGSVRVDGFGALRLALGGCEMVLDRIWRVRFEGDTAGHDTDALVSQVARQVQDFTGEPIEWIHLKAWSPAHNAVEMEDLPKLRELLDAGHDVEDDDGTGWTLLHHAIDAEIDAHTQSGEREPLHVDVTAFLLARGADPMRPYNGVPAIVAAETRGHWLAAEVMRMRIGRGCQS